MKKISTTSIQKVIHKVSHFQHPIQNKVTAFVLIKLLRSHGKKDRKNQKTKKNFCVVTDRKNLEGPQNNLHNNHSIFATSFLEGEKMKYYKQETGAIIQLNTVTNITFLFKMQHETYIASTII